MLLGIYIVGAIFYAIFKALLFLAVVVVSALAELLRYTFTGKRRGPVDLSEYIK